MESATKVIELTIGDVTYNFTLEFWYYPGKGSIDPTESEDEELITWDFDGPIEAWNNKTDVGYQVSDPYEIEYIKGNIDAEDEFLKAIS